MTAHRRLAALLLALLVTGCRAEPYDPFAHTLCAGPLCWSELAPARPVIISMNRGMRAGPTGPAPGRWHRVDLTPYVRTGDRVGLVTLGGSIAISGGPGPNCAVYVYLRAPGTGVEAHAVKATKSAGVGGTRTPWQRAIAAADNAIEWKWRATAPPWPGGCTAGVSGLLQWYVTLPEGGR